MEIKLLKDLSFSWTSNPEGDFVLKYKNIGAKLKEEDDGYTMYFEKGTILNSDDITNIGYYRVEEAFKLMIEFKDAEEFLRETEEK